MYIGKKIKYGLSLKKDGDMRIGSSHYEKNRKNFFRKIGLDPNNSVAAGLKHGTRVKCVGVRDKGTTIPSTDALVTADKKAILTVTVADCLPVYIFNSSGSAVGLVHAGWQGVSKNIVSKTIKVFTQKYNIAVQDIKLIIGPHIKDCHFEVGADVAKKFQEYRNSIINRNKKIYIDLASVVKEQAVSLGVKPASIEISQDCVYCQKKYYSFRRDKPKAVEGAMAYIVMPSASLRADT